MFIRKFFLRLFAAIGVIAILLVALAAFIGWRWINRPVVQPKMPEKAALILDFSRPIGDSLYKPRLSFASLLEKKSEVPLLDITRAIERAKDDPRVKGIIALIHGTGPSFTHAQEIATALQHFRESGKFTYIYAPSYGDFGPGSTPYFLASQFENIWLQPVGAVGLTGLGIDAPFGKTALGQLGIQTDFLRREEYKSVMENVSRDDFSPPVRANMESMLTSLQNQIVEGIAKGRKIDPAKARDLVENGPYTASEALKAGLVSKIGFEDELHDEIYKKFGNDLTWLIPPMYLYLTGKAANVVPKAKAAFISAEGVITDSPDVGPYRLAKDGVIDTNSIVTALGDAAGDKEIKAIILRINSPGGSPVASETIRHALAKAKKSKKPIIVSMGNVAASGGYWIAMEADTIIANPSTITGSIGVVAGKAVLGGLYDKLGIKWDTLSTMPNAALWSTRTPFDERGRERMNAMLDETYKVFTDGVSAARKIPAEKIPEIAKGRVFTGEQALKAGLVDELGGVETAVQTLKKKLNLDPKDQIALVQYPAPETPRDLLIRAFKNFRLGGAMVEEMFGYWQKAKASIDPLIAEWDAAQSPMQARLPSVFTGAVK